MKKMLINVSVLLSAVLLMSTVMTGCDGTPSHSHTDADGDELCDECGKSVRVELTFLAVNDLHGKFKDSDTQPGLDEFTTYLKGLYADDAREEILLSSGDMWQGTVESSANRGKLMTEWMNEAGFVSMTLGNHEYDWGPDTLGPNSKLAEFPFLGINITYNGSMPSYCKASTVVERSGMKIGIIGAIGDCLSSISGEFQSGLSFATGSSLTSLVKKEADRLRKKEGCDFIVYSIHDGGDSFPSSGITTVENSDMAYYDTSLSDGYVDLVFEAHTHQKYILKDEYGVYHLQGSSENRAVSAVNVSFNTVTKDCTVEPGTVAAGTYAEDSLADDPIVSELIGKYFPDSDPYETIGYNVQKRDSETIINKVAELYYQKGRELWGSQYTISAGGGYLNARSPYRISAGNVSYADVFSVLPFDNHLVLGELSGTDFVKFLNRQDAESNPYHIYTTVKAAEVDTSKKYYVVVDTYTSTYRYNNIKEVARLDKDYYARDLIADYIRGGNWAK